MAPILPYRPRPERSCQSTLPRTTPGRAGRCRACVRIRLITSPSKARRIRRSASPCQSIGRGALAMGSAWRQPGDLPGGRRTATRPERHRRHHERIAAKHRPASHCASGDAGEGTRTPKGFRPPAPKAGVSTSSTTPAGAQSVAAETPPATPGAGPAGVATPRRPRSASASRWRRWRGRRPRSTSLRA